MVEPGREVIPQAVPSPLTRAALSLMGDRFLALEKGQS